MRLLSVQREVLAWGYCRAAWQLVRREGGNEARPHHWEAAARRTWGVDHGTVTRELWPVERTPLLVGRWQHQPPRDAVTLALLGFGPPEVALLAATDGEARER